MVDTKDLKSFGHCGCAGSSPASSTKREGWGPAEENKKEKEENEYPQSAEICVCRSPIAVLPGSPHGEMVSAHFVLWSLFEAEGRQRRILR